MTPAEATWENEGGACYEKNSGVDPLSTIGQSAAASDEAISPGAHSSYTYSPAIRALTDCELAIMRQLACEFFGSVQTLEDGNLEGLEMAESSTFDYAPAVPAEVLAS